MTHSLIIIGVTGVITPLGLGERTQAGQVGHPLFYYVPDSSAFGYGTPPRYERFARVCGDPICPGREEDVQNLYDESRGR